MLVSHFEDNLVVKFLLRCITCSCVLLCFVALPQVRSQDSSEVSNKQQADTSTQDRPAVLPRGFAGIALQDTRDSVLQKLEKHTIFFSPDEPELTLLPATKEQIIEVVGKRFVKKALFQFNTGLQLVVITLYLDTEVVDYFRVYTTHEKKYGRAHTISPSHAQWQEGDITILIEKPLQVKYIYLADATQTTDSQPIGKQKAQTRMEERDEFLSLF